MGGAESDDDTETEAERLARIQWLYTLAVKRHGPQAKGVGWRDRRGQLLRFAQLVRVMEGEPAGAAVTVNDLGCGYGALFPFLLRLPHLRIAAYTGYDMTAAMVAAARAAVPDHRAAFIESDHATREADYGFASGTFNVLAGGDALEWTAAVIAHLRAFAAMNRRGMAFNMLSPDHPRPDRLMFYTRPEPFQAALEADGRDTTLLTGYLPGDWTLLVRW